MKKIIVFILTILTAFSICGCSCSPTITHWKPMQNKQNVKAIYLVEYKKDNNYTIVKSFDLEILDTLCADISSLPMTEYMDQNESPIGDGFLIEYLNGVLDIVSKDRSGAGIYKNEKIYCNGYPYSFNAKDYDKLINKYLDM